MINFIALAVLRNDGIYSLPMEERILMINNILENSFNFLAGIKEYKPNCDEKLIAINLLRNNLQSFIRTFFNIVPIEYKIDFIEKCITHLPFSNGYFGEALLSFIKTAQYYTLKGIKHVIMVHTHSDHKYIVSWFKKLWIVAVIYFVNIPKFWC